MAATDMNKAGFEPGCKVTVQLPPPGDGSLSQDEITRVLLLDAQGPWTFVRSEFPYYIINGPGAMHTDGARWIREHYSYITRDYDDAQAARHRRFRHLDDYFGGEAGSPDPTDTIERFVCVQKHADGNGFTYMWGDDLETAVARAGDNMLNGDAMPEGVYDLDTGQKIELHVSSPRLSPAEDQEITINEMDPDEVAQNEAYISQVYDEVAVEFAISLTVPPDKTEVVEAGLHPLLGSSWIEHAAVRRAVVRQLNPDKSKAYSASQETAAKIQEALQNKGRARS